MKRRSMADLMARAHDELAHNPTITVYTVDADGTIRRRRANPWATVWAAGQAATEAFARLGDQFTSAAAKFAQFLNQAGER